MLIEYVAAAVLLAVNSPQSAPDGAPLAAYVGEWVNTDAATRGVAAFKIEKTANGLRVSIGRDTAQPIVFTPGVDVKPEVSTVVVLFSTPGRTYLIRSMKSDQLQLEMLTQFDDGSGRSNYRFVGTFTKYKGL